MKIIADFHIHSRFARGCSKDLSMQKLEEFARMKGLSLLGTGDFTHPDHLKELKQELVSEQEGIHFTKTHFPFLLQTEVSLIYTQGGKGRRIHHILLAPSFEVVDQINAHLATKGNLRSDGRPIIGRYSSVELAEDMHSISPDIEIIPAHAWTPYFAVFGSKSGFDSMEECFQEKTKYIHAFETGMSSDPAMNWRISSLDKFNPVSNSDCHSFWPWRLGREANVFDIPLTYKAVLAAIRERKGFVETLETDPAYGKYHYDGHRACTQVQSPEETKQKGERCPKCNRTLTIGVANRIESLADREPGFVKKNAIPFRKVVPLSEIIAARYKTSPSTKKAWEVYHKLIRFFGSEFSVLFDVPEETLRTVVDNALVSFILQNRNQTVVCTPGYDGEYGKPRFV